MIRNLCVFIDGTNQDRSKAECATDSNVVRLYYASPNVGEGDVQQRCYYRKGVGTRSHETITGAALGFGLDERITEAKMWLDDECKMAREDGCEPRIYLFGFSRGAFAARVLATFLKRDIEMIGVWDTVNATPGNDFGIADLPSYVKHAYHAMAIDERRSIFDVFRFNPTDTITERWFAGSHTDVGGGYENHELADIALHWMAVKAASHGLIIDGKKIDLDKPVDLTIKPVIHDENNIGWWVTNIFKKSQTVVERLVGATDSLDATVLFIRDHWRGLLNNSTLADNQMFMTYGYSDDIMV